MNKASDRKANEDKMRRNNVLRIDLMPESEREGLIDEIIALDREVFIDRDLEKTKNDLRGAKSDECWLLTIREGSKLIAYNRVMMTYLKVKGRKVCLWIPRSAVAPGYRGLKQTGSFALRLFFPFRLRHPLMPVYCLTTLIHPSSFRLFTRSVPTLYPFPKADLSQRDGEVFEACFSHKGLQCIEGRPDFVVVDSTVTRSDDIEADYWHRSPDPAIQFFHKYNSDYADGQAIATFVRINLSMMIQIGRQQFLGRSYYQKLRARFSPRFRDMQKIQSLESFAFLKNLKRNEKMILVKRLKSRWLKPDEVLLKQGDSGRSLFLILNGSLLVDQETYHGTETIAQLQVGDPVGEFGMIYGIPRIASVRSFRYTQVLELSPEILQELGPESDAIYLGILKVIGQRLADNYLRDIAHFKSRSHGDRLKLIRQIRMELLQEGEEIQSDGKTEIILVKGSVMFNGNSYSAPKGVSLQNNDVLRAQEAARIMAFTQSAMKTKRLKNKKHQLNSR